MKKFLNLKKKAGRWRGGFGRLFVSDGITDEFETTARTLMWPVRRLNCRRTHRGMWNGRSVRWRVYVSVSYQCHNRRSFRRWNRRKKLIYDSSADPLLPYFSFFFLIPSLPICKQPAPLPPKKKNLPYISTTSYISWSFMVTASVFWFTDGFYQFL